MIQCDCAERIGIEINSYDSFIELQKFFENQVVKGAFSVIPVENPYYIGFNSTGKALKWYANAWYKCKVCGTLWEIRYPDFPASGFVRKFADGQYRPRSDYPKRIFNCCCAIVTEITHEKDTGAYLDKVERVLQIAERTGKGYREQRLRDIAKELFASE